MVGRARSKLRRLGGQDALQLLGVHGLGQVEVEPGLIGAAAVLVLAIAGDGDRRQPFEARKIAQPRDQLVAVEDRQPEVDERQLRRIEAIIGSMTPEERKYVDVIDGSRKRRIARGSGTSVEDVNRLLKQFHEMQRMLKMVGSVTGQPIAAPPKRKKKKGPFSMIR